MFSIYCEKPSGDKFYLNLVQGSDEETSMKLPGFIVDTPDTATGRTRNKAEDEAKQRWSTMVAVMGYLRGRFGSNIPDVYLANEKGKDLVMDMPIYKEHIKCLQRAPKEAKMKLIDCILIFTLEGLHQRVSKNEFVEQFDLPGATIRFDDVIKPKGARKAREDEIRDFFYVWDDEPVSRGNNWGLIWFVAFIILVLVLVAKFFF